MALSFRTAGAEDADLVHAITRRAYAVWLPILGYPPRPAMEDHAPRIARGEVLLACDGQEARGLIVVEPRHDHHLIFSVAVDPDHAGTGLGRLMIAEAERRAADAGAARMVLYTNALMARNIALYQRLGYRETGRRPVADRPGAFILDMEKLLTAGT